MPGTVPVDLQTLFSLIPSETLVVLVRLSILYSIFFFKTEKPKFREIESSTQDQTERIRIQSQVCLKTKACAYSHYKPLLLSTGVLMRKMSTNLTSEIPVRMSRGDAFIIIIIFSSTSLLLPAHLPPPFCSHAQSCNPMDCSPPGSSVHGLFQARILEWVAKVMPLKQSTLWMPCSRGLVSGSFHPLPHVL